MDYIKGKFKKTIYEASSGNGYKVGLFRVKEASDNLSEELVNRTITFTGYFYDLMIDENYVFHGVYVENGKYGFQFQVSSYEHVKPEGKDAIIDFLSSSLVKGCGEKTALEIVKTLGDDALNRIKEDKFVLMNVPKMTEKKMESIYNSIVKYQDSDEIIVYLTKLGFSMKDAMTLLNVYGSSIKSVIEENIYSLINEVDFKTLDKVYFSLKDETDENRIEACIIEAMKTLSFEAGDTYSYREEIREKLLSFDIVLGDEEFDKYADILAKKREIKILEDKYFLYNYYKMEESIASILYEISNHKETKITNLDSRIEDFEKSYGVSYNADQKRAIKTALSKNITIITGGPGTGKTTIVKAIARLYIDTHEYSENAALESLALLAPTGRAAKRLADLTGLPAMTIHRYLRWDKVTGKFEYNEHFKHTERLIIVDETSMIDTETFDALLKGISSNVRLIIVGDDNQLPSVGPGLILADLIASELFNHVPLKEIYRQSIGSSIPYLCLSIKNHELEEESLSRKDDFSFLPVDVHLIKETIREICKLSIKKGIDSSDIQVLAPMYKGENGIDNLNVILQDLFNPRSLDKTEIKLGDVIYRVGDKVLQLVNDPDNNIYNGDIGYIMEVNSGSKDKLLVVNFYGNAVFYKRDDLINLKHAYAITIHKSQGSEFDHVIMPITINYGRMLYNKLLYTGISRAKKSLTLLGSPQAFYMGTNNDYSLNRKTNLVENLMNKLR
ncbi:MAG TPA: ATP-dependent RecD-like DNA helicase [Firmicutes bacterium]|nr:ATP-dependent RecD-like DNA helicase [Bacillota bacterium]